MPSRNIIKIDIPDSYYHIYARGVSKSVIYRDPDDKVVFLNLLKRYLSANQVFDKKKFLYPNYSMDIELLAFCLMDNHFHMLIYQHADGSMSGIMKSLLTSYSLYFNKKYNRTGPLFESRYKASNIDSDNYLHHISRYIHLNPKDWRNYSFSSLPYYISGHQSDWVKPKKILDLFDTQKEYEDFVADYEDNKAMIDELKHELASL